MTTDYAMQNVLLQMGLLLASHSGKLIRSVKQWVLKCDSCFSIWPANPTNPVDAMFCKKCGNATLARLGVTLGADGTPRYHYKKNRHVNTRGSVFSIPSSTGGRHADLLLRADQLLTGGWKEKMRQSKQNVRESLLADRSVAMDEQEAWLGGGARRHGGNTAMIASPHAAANMLGVEVGFGRRNPNSNRTHKHRGGGGAGGKRRE
jgi:RNA-binding protein NOB1